jgi:phosphopantetheinyl transferase (holo-ACP synthase)
MTIAFICAFLYSQFKYRHFKIVKATSRTWMTTRMGDIVTYKIQLITKKTSEELKLDELWVDNRLFKVRLVKRESNVLAKHFAEKETLYLEAERETKNIGYEEMRPSNHGKVSVGYLINNKRKYLSVKGFEEHTSKLSISGQV